MRCKVPGSPSFRVVIFFRIGRFLSWKFSQSKIFLLGMPDSMFFLEKFRKTYLFYVFQFSKRNCFSIKIPHNQIFFHRIVTAQHFLM